MVEILRLDPTGQWLHETDSLSADASKTDLILAKFTRIVEERVVTHGINRTALFRREGTQMLENVTVPLAQDGTTADMLAGFCWFTTLSGGKI